MRLPPRLVTAWSLAGLSSLAHCGGGLTAAPGADASLDDAGASGAMQDATGLAHDAGADALAADGASCSGLGCNAPDVFAPDVFAPVLCPPTPAAVGSACAAPEELCEYGGSWWLGCNRVLRCSQGFWQPYYGTGCVPADAGGACPATWDQAVTAADASAGACPAADCQYPEGACECLAGCGGRGQRRFGIGGVWYCEPATAQCPTPRPDLGTPCSEAGASCSYGLPCGCGEQLSCVHGVWQGYGFPPCP